MDKIAGHTRIGDAIEERANLVAEMKAQLDGIDAQRRDMTKAEREDYDGKEARVNELQNAIDLYERDRRSSQFVNGMVDGHQTDPDAFAASRFRRRNRQLNGDQDAALRAIDAHARSLSPEAGDRLVDLVERDRRGHDSRYLAAVSDPAYRSAFAKRVARPETAHQEFTPEEAEACARVAEIMGERRAMSVGSDGGGGYAVPFDLDPTILLTSDGAINPIRALASHATVEFADEWRGIASEGISAHFYAEATEVSDDSPTLTQPVIRPERAAVFVPYSEEVGEDWENFAISLSELIRDSKDVLEAEKFTLGAGHASNEPQGLLTAGSVVATAGTAVLTVDDIYATQQAVPPRFSPRSSWLANNSTLNTVYRLVPNASTIEPSLVAPDRSAILGRGVAEVSDYPAATDTTPTSGGTILTYGDINAAYKVVDRVGMSVEVIPHLFGDNGRPTGERGLYARWRTSGGVVNPNAIRHLKVT